MLPKLKRMDRYLIGATLMLMVAIVSATILLVPRNPVLKYGPSTGFSLEQNLVSRTSFQGIGSDVDFPAESIIEGTRFHSSLYSYRFENIIIDSSATLLSLRGEVVWLGRASGEELGRAKLSGIGHHVGAWASISYFGELKTEKSSDIWSGTFTLRMPTSGSAHGYFLTMHSDDDPSTPEIEAGARYALGNIALNRVL